MYFFYRKTKIYYEKYGIGKKVLLILPGWGDHRKSFNYFIQNLQHEFTIYIFDYPSFGKSDTLTEDWTIYDYAQAIISFMKEKKIRCPSGCGHSFGGRILITMSGYFHIPFEKLILTSSAGIKPRKSWWQKIKQATYKLLKLPARLLPKKYQNHFLNFLIKIFASSDFQSLPKPLRKTFIQIVNEDLTSYLEKIRSETLLIWGDNDTQTPLKDAYLMQSKIKNSGLVIIKKATHFAYLEKPSYFFLILRNFLNCC